MPDCGPSKPIVRLIRLSRLARAIVVSVACLSLRAGPLQAEGHLFLAGPYSFSDELGGFDIVAISGKGTREDPIVITEDFNSATPATLTIRTTRQIRPFDASGDFPNGILYMRIETINSSGQGWVEFEFELQEQLTKPSTFGDGLSFDQRSAATDTLSSDRFAEYSRDFEPYDKVLFRKGKVDPKAVAGFSLLITDFTPRWTFYLVQDPRIPSS